MGPTFHGTLVGPRSDATSRRPSDDAKLPRRGDDDVARVKLASAPVLPLAVDQHGVIGQEAPDLAAVVDKAGELQELAEPDGVAADRHVDGHGAAATPPRRSTRAAASPSPRRA